MLRGTETSLYSCAKEAFFLHYHEVVRGEDGELIRSVSRYIRLDVEDLGDKHEIQYRANKAIEWLKEEVSQREEDVRIFGLYVTIMQPDKQILEDVTLQQVVK